MLNSIAILNSFTVGAVAFRERGDELLAPDREKGGVRKEILYPLSLYIAFLARFLPVVSNESYRDVLEWGRSHPVFPLTPAQASLDFREGLGGGSVALCW